jgi:hypothetical protein
MMRAGRDYRAEVVVTYKKKRVAKRPGASRKEPQDKPKPRKPDDRR